MYPHANPDEQSFTIHLSGLTTILQELLAMELRFFNMWGSRAAPNPSTVSVKIGSPQITIGTAQNQHAQVVATSAQPIGPIPATWLYEHCDPPITAAIGPNLVDFGPVGLPPTSSFLQIFCAAQRPYRRLWPFSISTICFLFECFECDFPYLYRNLPFKFAVVAGRQ